MRKVANCLAYSTILLTHTDIATKANSQQDIATPSALFLMLALVHKATQSQRQPWRHNS
jgi:hypothetical protein